MPTSIQTIGAELQEAFGVSPERGHEVLNDHFDHAELEIFHIPEAPGDGRQSLTRADVSRKSAGVAGLDRRVTVENVRQLGDDTLVLQRVVSGTLPDSTTFSFPVVSIFTIKGGRIVRVIEVESREMLDTLTAAFRQLGALPASS